MASTHANTSLADLGFEVLQHFQRLETIDDEKKPQDWPETALTTEAERFELWAANLGLFVVGHGSLDYRVREADRLAQTMRRFLQELIDSLADGEIFLAQLSPLNMLTRGLLVFQMCAEVDGENSRGLETGEEIDSDDETEELNPARSDLEISEDDSTDESDLELLLDGVRDPIDRLYKVSTKVRNPSSRLRSSKAFNHQQIDEDTGVDFLRVVEQADLDHTRALFLQYQKDRALQEQEPTEPSKDTSGEVNDDGVWEPIRTILAPHRIVDSFLIRRIARANVRRRQQFAYRKTHREKLTRHARASISSMGALTPGTENPSFNSLERLVSNDSSQSQAALSPPLPSITTATNLNLARLELADNQSTFTVSEYAPSAWQPTRDAVSFPPPPVTTSGAKYFECPYCFTICPRETLAGRAWKAHLIHDLCPYICTYEDCSNPDQSYDNCHDWEHHENSCHRKVWRCLEHSNETFTQLEAYRDHLRSEHGDYRDDLMTNRIIRSSESTVMATDRACPVCSVVLESARALQGHIALHLERFSLFSLPRSIACGDDKDDDVSHADSDRAIGSNEGSRDQDFEGDFEVVDEDDNVASPAEEDERRRGKPEFQVGPETPSDDPNTQAVLESGTVARSKTALTKEAIRAFNTHATVAKEGKDTEPENMAVVTGTTATTFEDHNTPIYTVAFSPDDQVIASVSDDRAVRLWDLASGAPPAPFQGHKSGFRSLAWSHDGRIIASGSYDKTTKIWDVETGTCLHTLTGHSAAVSGLSFSSDDKLLASASHDKTAKLWDVGTGAVRFTFRGHTAGLYSIGVSPDDKYIVSGSNDRTVKVWDLDTGGLIHTLRGHGRVIYTVAFSPDSQILVTGGNDRVIKVWDLAQGAVLRSIKAHEGGIAALAFSPDGSLLASGSYDRTIKLWDPKTWESVGVLDGHSAEVYAVSFSRNGQRLASGSRDRTLRLWDITV